MADFKPIVLVLAASLAAIAARDAAAQAGPGAAIPRLVQECLPPHLACRMRPIAVPTEIRGRAGYGMINESKCWPAGKTLKVCFLEGTHQETCRRIAGIANEWADPKGHSNSIAFDFGQTPPGNDCRVFAAGDPPSEIRISFRYRGIWSLVGQDSRKAIPGEPTMSLENFDIAPPDEPQFRAAVLHEFGHALGFLHQHPHTESGCAFAEAIYERFRSAADPWDARQVDASFKLQTYFDSPILVKDDGPSVMHRPLAPWMLERGEKDPCYAPPGPELSEGDRKAAQRVYPLQTKDRNKDASDKLLDLAGTSDLTVETRALLLGSANLLASMASKSPHAPFAGGGGIAFDAFLAVMEELSNRDRPLEYLRGAWVVLQKSAEQESRLLADWINDIESYNWRFALRDDATQKNLDKMKNYIRFFDEVQQMLPPGPADGQDACRKKRDQLADLVEKGRRLPR
jgi:hypothetical protein